MDHILDFVDKNSYFHRYVILIQMASGRNTSDLYTETHHILPKSIRRDNSTFNLVKLTPTEHYLAHYYLYKCANHLSYSKFLYAFKMMNNRKRISQISEEDLPDLSQRFEEERSRIRALVSDHLKGRKAHVWTEDMKERKKKTYRERKALGWYTPKKRTPEQNEANRLRQLGKKMSAESSLKKSLATKGRPLSEDHKKAIKLARKNSPSKSPLRKQVLCLETGVIYDSQAEASKSTGVRLTLIREKQQGLSKLTQTLLHFKILSTS